MFRRPPALLHAEQKRNGTRHKNLEEQHKGVTISASDANMTEFPSRRAHTEYCRMPNNWYYSEGAST
jgi:hypothetical protein